MINIAIDGPAGAGKSTIAKRVAAEKNYIYVDTGAMYRAMALYLYRNGIDADDSAAISDRCGEPDITIEYRNGEQVVLLNGENVNGFLRTPQVSDMASRSSVNPDVRAKLLELQQEGTLPVIVHIKGHQEPLGNHVQDSLRRLFCNRINYSCEHCL